ncbi:hypothetical protein M885DRAFT_612595 [Pelagophyceae sp. CCMP2097]|nr:hypothetical protein M885DRAFT_612595 [Pelagophyceae sp. CCMP2097]
MAEQWFDAQGEETSVAPPRRRIAAPARVASLQDEVVERWSMKRKAIEEEFSTSVEEEQRPLEKRVEKLQARMLAIVKASRKAKRDALAEALRLEQAEVESLRSSELEAVRASGDSEAEHCATENCWNIAVASSNAADQCAKRKSCKLARHGAAQLCEACRDVRRCQKCAKAFCAAEKRVVCSELSCVQFACEGCAAEACSHCRATFCADHCRLWPGQQWILKQCKSCFETKDSMFNTYGDEEDSDEYRSTNGMGDY